MKRLFILSTLFAMPAFASPPAVPSPEPVNPVVQVSKPVQAEVRISRKQARAECLKENGKLQGKALKSCVHGKIHR